MRLVGIVVFNDELVLDDVDRYPAHVLFTPALRGRSAPARRTWRAGSGSVLALAEPRLWSRRSSMRCRRAPRTAFTSPRSSRTGRPHRPARGHRPGRVRRDRRARGSADLAQAIARRRPSSCERSNRPAATGARPARLRPGEVSPAMARVLGYVCEPRRRDQRFAVGRPQATSVTASISSMPPAA